MFIDVPEPQFFQNFPTLYMYSYQYRNYTYGIKSTIYMN